MKKIISVLMILAMVMALAACGKKETPSDPGNEVTKAAKKRNRAYKGSGDYSRTYERNNP